MNKIYTEWDTVIREFDVYDTFTKEFITVPESSGIKWQRTEDNEYIIITLSNRAEDIKCGNFYIENYVMKNLTKEMLETSQEVAQEVKRCEDSFEITEPTEIQKEQARKIMGQKTETEIVIDYLQNAIENCSDKGVTNWLCEESNRLKRRLETINFCNASDKDIISQALIHFSNSCRVEGKHSEANKIDTVRENYLGSFEEVKAVEND